MDHKWVEEAILIRRVEESFLELFSEGKLNGTVHTCVGQEYSAVAFAGQLESKDFIFSNHRCHGHYISFTKDYEGLIAELMGKEHGTCGGVGSSQHLCKNNFYSNGIQGGIVPVAAGMALANKIKNNDAIGIVFIGDGTLGEGVVYETMNIISKWEIPLLIVCENNRYSQSTTQSTNLAGDILARAKAFGINTFHSNTWATKKIISDAKEAIETVRQSKKPAFHLVDTYRLNPHSKGDDHRDKDEIETYRSKDPIVLFEKEYPEEYKKILDEINSKITTYIKSIESDNELPVDQYHETNKLDKTAEWMKIDEIDIRQVDLLNGFFDEYLNKDKNMVYLGEDILSPYGGAFKVSKNLSAKYPLQLFSTPISEQAITGITNGLALAGMKPYLEIMFGDFVTLSLDQIINHASKFYHMYNKQIRCPMVLRTPMGGGRGYGPTHSQTLDKFLVGIDNVNTIALNTLIDPAILYKSIHEEQNPTIVIENKLDYGRKIAKKKVPNYIYERTDDRYPLIRLRPIKSTPNATLVAYGGMVDTVIDSLTDLFLELDIKAEVFILTQIHPLNIDEVVKSVHMTGKLYTIEEGSAFAGIGAEVIAHVSDTLSKPFISRRIASLPVPIASSKTLEAEIITNKKRILEIIKGSL
ncbi:dehydrogenase E1 component subunit alpha/beta [Sulfuricurvum sp.]|uniref:dehydrogenase E1 component subunit alpha/beta n=1 Tax=Sulfuricurvum sp. TaxID=2025608 RepID=UPI003BB69CE9